MVWRFLSLNRCYAKLRIFYMWFNDERIDDHKRFHFTCSNYHSFWPSCIPYHSMYHFDWGAAINDHTESIRSFVMLKCSYAMNVQIFAILSSNSVTSKVREKKQHPNTFHTIQSNIYTRAADRTISLLLIFFVVFFSIHIYMCKWNNSFA